MSKKLLILFIAVMFALEASMVMAYHGSGVTPPLNMLLFSIIGVIIFGALVIWYLRKISMETGKKK